MLRITENNEVLTFREISDIRLDGIFGYSIVIFFLIFYLLSTSITFTIVGVIICSTILLIGAFIQSSTTTYINKRDRYISIKKRSILNNTTEIFSFDEITDLIYIDESKDLHGNTNYKMILPFKSGQKVEFFSSVSLKTGQYFKTADLINNYIFDSPDQIPFRLTVFYED